MQSSPRVFGIACGALLAMWSLGGPAVAGEPVNTGLFGGVAIMGYDPVAYFTDRKPVAGKPDLEYRHAGAIWRFGNEGNRAAFARDPQVYMPRFGGYDPVGVSKGLSTAGYPELWVVYEERLYLFYTENARQTFMANPSEVIAAAAARWADVRGELAE